MDDEHDERNVALRLGWGGPEVEGLSIRPFHPLTLTDLVFRHERLSLTDTDHAVGLYMCPYPGDSPAPQRELLDRPLFLDLDFQS